jgi:hypothetical protein
LSQTGNGTVIHHLKPRVTICQVGHDLSGLTTSALSVHTPVEYLSYSIKASRKCGA